ncbi:hypothetical protein ACT691_14500 [Vibrio metschnikovii]
MQQSQRVSAVFDYASFLEHRYTKRWNFSDVLASFVDFRYRLARYR